MFLSDPTSITQICCRGAKVIEITEAAAGGPDLGHLRSVLKDVAEKGPIIGSFSAASNVTGVCADVIAVSRIIKSLGGLVVWDYAGGGPYLTVNMSPESDALIDAVVFSPHKFIGGPGASGVLVVRRDAVKANAPAFPGGGTVAFVNHDVHDYSDQLEEREEGGTPNIIGDIRACLSLMVKDAMGQDFIIQRNTSLAERAFETWQDNKHIRLLGVHLKDRLPIFSFIVLDSDGNLIDYQLFARMLSDLYGIQARGGCACAGPYVHQLLNIDGSGQTKSGGRF